HLKDGTSTVTWRVVSADGHPVHGGLAFSVGARSAISAVAGSGNRGAGRVVGWGYGAVRFLWFGAFLALVGMVALRAWVWTPAVRATGLVDSRAAARCRAAFAGALPLAWVALAVAGGLELVFQTASVSGLSLVSSAHPHVLSQLLDTTYGRYWRAQMMVTGVLALPVYALVRRRPLARIRPPWWLALFAVVVAALAATVGANGHARTLRHPALGVPAVSVHLLAIAVWVGALGSLVVLGSRSWRMLEGDERVWLVRQLVPRFSRVAIVAVTVVVATGVLNALLDVGAVSDLWRLTYGRVVLAKVIVLALALALAARHLWVVPRRLAQPVVATRTTGSFERSTAAELALLACAVAFAAGLVALVPGRMLALAASWSVNAERRLGTYTAQVFLDPSAVGANQLHVTFVNVQGLAAAEVTRADVLVGPLGGSQKQVAMRLISPGHFVGDVRLPAAGRYRLRVSSPSAPGAITNLTFRIKTKEPR